MTNTTKTAAKVSLKLTALDTANEYGGRQPTMMVTVPGGSHREQKAALHSVAAATELASASARWLVQIGRHDDSVYLELAEGTAAESAAGLAVLHAIADRISKAGRVAQ